MEKKIVIIGHVDHSKTTLSATLSEIIEEGRCITITNTLSHEYLIKSGQQSRRERRAKERKNKRK